MSPAMEDRYGLQGDAIGGGNSLPDRFAAGVLGEYHQAIAGINTSGVLMPDGASEGGQGPDEELGPSSLPGPFSSSPSLPAGSDKIQRRIEYLEGAGRMLAMSNWACRAARCISSVGPRSRIGLTRRYPARGPHAGTLSHLRRWLEQLTNRYHLINPDATRPVRRVYVGNLYAWWRGWVRGHLLNFELGLDESGLVI